jgi:hypothetical protein
MSSVPAAQFVGAGFKAGVLARPLLDLASARYGRDWLNDDGIQEELVATCFDEPLFTFGRRREKQLLRLMLDEIDASEGSDDGSLSLAACERATASTEELRYLLIQIEESRLRISSAMSDIGSTFDIVICKPISDVTSCFSHTRSFFSLDCDLGSAAYQYWRLTPPT